MVLDRDTGKQRVLDEEGRFGGLSLASGGKDTVCRKALTCTGGKEKNQKKRLNFAFSFSLSLLLRPPASSSSHLETVES